MRKCPKDTVAKEEDSGAKEEDRGAKEEGRLPTQKKGRRRQWSGCYSLLHEGMLGAEF
jgi:hypothetical protein